MKTLAQGEEDTVGVCSACLDVIANLKALKKGIKEVQCMHANITTFRTEVKTWLANQKVHIACLQEDSSARREAPRSRYFPGWNGLPNLVLKQQPRLSMALLVD